ncbi:hypothetical protein [Streptomyces sp. NPDC101455]|uniref:hypothetical protein n=1 Tax=Streptomyces sp. NPDC101455 TaxID=3366142 RepID=UPI00380289BD
MSHDDVSFDSAEAPEVVAQYARWFSVTDPGNDELYPRLVLGADSCELHLELDAESLDELLASLATQLSPVQSDVQDTDELRHESLPARLGSRAVAVSGWSATSRFWHGANANTRIVVYGVIAAFVVFGLLVTF